MNIEEMKIKILEEMIEEFPYCDFKWVLERRFPLRNNLMASFKYIRENYLGIPDDTWEEWMRDNERGSECIALTQELIDDLANMPNIDEKVELVRYAKESLKETYIRLKKENYYK